ncbi:MAG: M1 family metallopeptidase [Planctomycetes bacterium]|nr:M1 family metallopeptidase [Planctomycetota bacterium]
MKKPFWFLLLAAVACSTPAPIPKSPTNRAALSVPTAPPLVAHEPRIADFDVENYSLELELDPAARAIRGTCKVRLWPRVEGLARVELDLVGLAVSRVSDADGHELRFEQDEDSVAIDLARPLGRTDFVELSVVYGGIPVRGLYFVADHGAGPTQVFTQGECEDARYWFPCFDFPNDRATSEIRVTLPPKWTSIAAGERIDHVELGEGRSIDHWRMTTPHPTYLETLCAGEFTVTESRWENVPLVFAVEPKFAPLVERCFEETDEVLTFLSDVTSFRYPYPKYAQVCVSDFRFGGMENISATTLTDTALRDELGNRDSTMTSLVAHEAAHQWFGDLLTCADWSHIWLNEGFATYMALLYVEATQGEEIFQDRLRETLEGYLAADVGPRRRPTVWNVYREPMDLFFDGQAYAGGALRLHHLRFVLGDELFFKGLREYVWSNAGRSVVTEDLQRAMERASGQDLEWFFQQWFYLKGYPEFAVKWEWDESAKEIVLDVEQVQETADGTPSAFRVPIEVLYGWGMTQDLARLEITKRHEQFRIKVHVQPDWVDFDPRMRLPRRAHLDHPITEAASMRWAPESGVRASGIASLAVVARDSAKSVADRGAALNVLWLMLIDPASDADARVAALAMGLAAAKEFERSALELLPPGDHGFVAFDDASKASTLRSNARTLLLRRLDVPSGAAARVAVWEGLTSFLPDEEIVVAARSEALEIGFSWQTRIQAARLVALSDKEHAREWVERCMQITSPQGEFQVGMLGILGEIEGAKALPFFQRWLEDASAPTQVRSAAARSIGAHGRADSSSHVTLERYLDDTANFALSGAVLDALFQLRDAASIPAVRKYLEAPVDSRHRRSAERILAANWAGG